MMRQLQTIKLRRSGAPAAKLVDPRRDDADTFVLGDEPADCGTSAANFRLGPHIAKTAFCGAALSKGPNTKRGTRLVAGASQRFRAKAATAA
jgi:hypothetical protein